MNTVRDGWRVGQAGMCLLLAVATVSAQPGGERGDRGFGGPGGGLSGFGGPGGGPPSSFRGRDPSSLLSNLSDNSFQEELKLTDEQNQKLGDIRSEQREAFGAMFRDGSINFREMSDEQRRERMREINRPFEERATKILTRDQTVIWEKRKTENLARETERSTSASSTSSGPSSSSGGTTSNAVRRQPLPNEPIPEGADVVASFKATAGDPGIRQQGEEAILRFNFRYAPWTEVLKLFADAAGLTLDLNDVPQGTFNYYDDRQFTATQALDVINGYLIPKGYIVIRRDRFLTCFNLDDPLPPNVIPLIAGSDLPHRGQNELVSVLVPLPAGLDADKVDNELRELAGPYGKVTALDATNSLVIQDLGGNVRRIYDMLMAMSPPDTRETAFKAIELKHISAAEAERMVRRLFGLNQVTTVSSSTPQFSGFGGSPYGGFGGPFGGGFPPFGGYSRDGDRDRYSSDRDRGGDSRSSSSSSSSSSRSSSSLQQSPYAGKIQITADARTNHLLVTASASLLKVVEDVVKSLDVDDGSAKSDSPMILQVYDVNGDATQIAYTLSLMMPGLAIIDDPKSAKLHVQATAEEHAEIAKLIQKLGTTGSNSVAVIQLKGADPVAVQNSVRNLFINDGSRAPTIEADMQGRRLMVRGTPDQVNQIKSLLTSMGVIDEPTTAGESSNRGNVRTWPLGGRDPEEFIPILRQMWSASEPNPIRIVVPSQPSPVRDRRIPSQTQVPDGRPTSELPPVERRRESSRIDLPAEPSARPYLTTPNVGTRSLFSVSRTKEQPTTTSTAIREDLVTVDDDEQDDFEILEDQLVDDPVDDDEQPVEPPKDFDNFLKSFLEAEPSAKPAAPVQQPGNDAAMTGPDGQTPIGVTVVGGDLVITSADEAALDQLEQMLETLAAAMPARTRWTVFYLRSADATETAQMLERLFPQSSVATSTQQSDGFLGSISGGFSSLGRGLMSSTGLGNTLGGQSLRIVTDLRANALFVTGPANLVSQVEEMLKILDANELPGNLRDRMPRNIPVEYADVEDVAAIVESVFKDAMTPEQQQQQNNSRGGFNPLAMMMGQGGQQGKAKGPELTLGIDRQTSNLIVSCNDQLFRQVEDLVISLDERARNLRQTVHVVPLSAADPMLVSTTLSTLIPKVKVSASRTSRSSNSSSSSGSRSQPGQTDRGSSGGSSDPGQEMFRAMMEQRMRESSRGGDSRGGDSRGGVPGGGFPSGFSRGR